MFLTLWRVLTYNQVDATLASLSILKYGALKWPHRVIRGSKIKSAWIFVQKYVRSLALTQEFQKCNYFSNATCISDVRCCKRSKVSIQIVQGSKFFKVAPIVQLSWKWWQIVHLLESIQKKNTLYYLKCQVTEIWCKKGLLPSAEWWPVTFWSKNIWRRHRR